MGYYLTLALNEIPEFKYRYENGNFYYYDCINPSFTEEYSDGTIGFFTVPLKEPYKEFINEYLKVKDKFLNKEIEAHQKQDVVWFSCEPWFNFTNVITPYDKKITIPQLIWDKFTFANNKVYTNLMINWQIFAYFNYFNQ